MPADDKHISPSPHYESLPEALLAHARELSHLRQSIDTAFDWFKANHRFATKADLDAMERRIMAALKPGSDADIAKLVKGTDELKGANDALEATVKAATPAT